MIGGPAGSLQDPRLFTKGACLGHREAVLAALQALTQVQRRVPQPISLVGIGPMVQEQLHWKWETQEELSEAPMDWTLTPTPNLAAEAHSKCAYGN